MLGPMYRDLIDNVTFYASGIPDILTKADIRGRAADLVHRRAGEANLQESSTSGSTGLPFRFFESDFDRHVHHQCFCRLYLHLPERHYRALSISDFPESDPADAERSSLVYRDPCGEEVVRHEFRFLSSRESCDVLADRVWSDSPQLLEGYASAIYLVARMLSEQGRALSSVQVISPCGEHLADEYRSAIAAAFPNARILCRYGANELGSLAWQCPWCDRYHFNLDFYAFRVLDGDRMAVTKRYASGCQLAHYDLGDRVRFVGMGECRVPLPAIAILEGRRDDILIDLDGKTLPIMPYHLGDVPELIQWQIVQQPDRSLDFNVIATRETADLAAHLTARLRADLRNWTLPLRVSFVRRINGTRKLKRVISLIPGAAPGQSCFASTQ
ncbi:MAG: hypothetical protein HYV63_17780 [Candidatus Schekmanbacteria bacterium]|nr:hypothetical protein [Candidatus Schekmanbacteria bacterium]